MIAIVADVHLGQQAGGLEAFLAMMERLRSDNCREIYFLGDIFQYLVASPKFESETRRRFLESVRATRARGARVVYVEGNRDFFLRGSYLAREFDQVAPEAAFTAGRRKFLLLHGDGINERDWPYRFWRRASKNSLSRAALDFVPAKAANRFVAFMERRLHDTNFRHKSCLPEEMIRRFAERRLARGYDVLLLGHFHVSWRAAIAGGEVEIVPPFLEERRWMVVDTAGQTALVSLS